MTETSAPRNAAEERVQRFMVEYDAQWRKAAPEFEDRDRGDRRDAFDLWRELMEQTTRNHFVEGTAAGFAQSFGRPPEYGPEAEQLVGSELRGDVAYVLTRSASPLEKFHEYTLHGQDGDWRISAIADHYGDPAQPFVDRAAVEERLQGSAADALFTEMPEAQARLDEARNFTVREVARGDGETARTEVSPIGTLVTSTGVLSVLDFGYDNNDARPLARTVAPGSYPVERVTAFGRNAAVRVRFTDEAPVSWHPASLPGSGHVFGVDAGCACIVDYVGYSTMTRREKTAAYDRFCAVERPATLEFPLGGGADAGIAVDSGYGDGGYPAYWGVDAEGEVAQLVVDFMVLVTEGDDGVLVHL